MLYVSFVHPQLWLKLFLSWLLTACMYVSTVIEAVFTDEGMESTVPPKINQVYSLVFLYTLATHYPHNYSATTDTYPTISVPVLQGKVWITHSTQSITLSMYMCNYQ